MIARRCNRSFYTTGADPMIVGFYKIMQSGGAGDKASKIEMVDLTPDDVKKASAPQDSPNGGKVCLNLKPTKKLVIVIEKKDENGTSTNRTKNFIGEKDRNLSFLLLQLICPNAATAVRWLGSVSTRRRSNSKRGPLV